MSKKFVSKNTFGAFDDSSSDSDSDGEQEIVQCNCQSSVCLHKVVCPAAFNLAREVTRRRFWLWSEYDADRMPCICCSPVHALEGEGETVWFCSNSGYEWLMVNNPQEAYLPVENMLWGDLILAQDQINYNKLSKAEKARLEMVAKAEREAMVKYAAQVEREKIRIAEEAKISFAKLQAEEEAERLAKTASFSPAFSRPSSSGSNVGAGGGSGQLPARIPGKKYDRKTGAPMPCRCHNHEGVLGKICPPESGTNKKGQKYSYPAGCQQHDEFKAGKRKDDCEFFHIGDPEFEQLKQSQPQTANTSSSWRSTTTTTTTTNTRPPSQQNNNKNNNNNNNKGWQRK